LRRLLRHLILIKPAISALVAELPTARHEQQCAAE
jgi:hypothetical protein